MAVTISDIAQRVGVTKTTVSRVLNKKSSSIRISEKTRLRVIESARELNYRPSFSARALARGRTNTIGFICGDIKSPYFSEMASVATEEAEGRGYHLLIGITKWDFKRELGCLETLLSRQVDGVMIWTFAPRVGVEQYEYIVKEKFPLVVVGDRAEGLASVDMDWRGGMGEVVEHLAGRGHSRIGFVGNANIDKATYGKRVAFLEACSGRQIEVSEYEYLPDMEQTVALGRRIGQDPARPSALVVCSDYSACGIIRGLGSRQLRVPDDVAVVGVDDTEMGRYFDPPLTSIGVEDPKAVVVKAIDAIFAMLDDKDIPRTATVLPTRLVVRSSA